MSIAQLEQRAMPAVEDEAADRKVRIVATLRKLRWVAQSLQQYSGRGASLPPGRRPAQRWGETWLAAVGAHRRRHAAREVC